MLGLEPDTLAGNFTALRELYHPDESESIMERLNKHIEMRDHYSEEIRLRHSSGEYRWYRIRGSASSQDDGTPERMSGSMTDIDGEVKTRQALLVSETMFRSLAENTSAVPWLAKSADKHFTFIGPQAERIFGHALSDWTDKGFFELYLHEDDRWAIEHFDRQVEKETDFQLEYRFRTADDQVKWVQEVVHVEPSEKGQLISGFLIDISKRKEAEQKLRVKEALLASAVNSLPFDLWACDRDSRYILQNRSSESRWGGRLGKKPEECGIDPQIVEIWHQNNHRALQGETMVSQVRYPHGDELRDFHSIVAPIQEGEEIVGFIGANIDITDLKKTEAALQIAEEALTESVNARDADTAKLQKVESELDQAKSQLTEAEQARDKAQTDLEESASELRDSKTAITETGTTSPAPEGIKITEKPSDDFASGPLNFLAESIWITDAESRTIFFNHSWCELMGDKSAASADWTEAIHGEDRANVQRAFKEAVTRQECFDHELAP